MRAWPLSGHDGAAFHAAFPGAFPLADTGGLERPHLCVLIDAEEDYDWNRPYSRANTQVTSFHNVARAQTVFDHHAIRPCYLVSYPIAADDDAAALLRGWLAQDRCAVGAHLHPWVTPPDEEVICLSNSFPCNLPAELEQRKLQVLSVAIADRLGQAPKVYKAGRGGFRFERREMLTDAGFEVDLSVQPGRNYAGLGGGPNFLGYPSQPFWSDQSRRLLHLPMTYGVAGPTHELTDRGADRILASSTARRLRVPTLLSRFGWLERALLTPDGMTLDAMRRLVGKLAGRGQRVFILSMRSSSFTPGCTPYARTTLEVDHLLARLNSFVSFFKADLGGVPATPLEIRQALTSREAGGGRFASLPAQAERHLPIISGAGCAPG